MEKLNIHADISEAYRYMGGVGAPEEGVAAELRRAAAIVEETASARFIERFCEIDRAENLTLKGTGLVLEGSSIAALLHDCERCVIFCVTIGSGLDALLRKWQLRDIAFAAMLDACASSAVESLCNGIEARLKDECGTQGLFLTDRF
ncbi:MAG: hypothetical protein QMB62_05350, partial [Oscillospiraceae bacterium]